MRFINHDQVLCDQFRTYFHLRVALKFIHSQYILLNISMSSLSNVNMVNKREVNHIEWSF